MEAQILYLWHQKVLRELLMSHKSRQVCDSEGYIVVACWLLHERIGFTLYID